MRIRAGDCRLVHTFISLTPAIPKEIKGQWDICVIIGAVSFIYDALDSYCGAWNDIVCFISL